MAAASALGLSIWTVTSPDSTVPDRSTPSRVTEPRNVRVGDDAVAVLGDLQR
jgi:hypothetical protein